MKHCVRLATLLVCGAWLLAVARAEAVAEAHLAPAPLTLVEAAPGDFVRVGACAEASAVNADGIANIGFILGTSGVAVIDPGGSRLDGERLRAAIRARTGLPIRYVIMTHAHPDHVFGGEAFLPDHPVFVGHWRLPAALATRSAYDRARLAASLGAASTGYPVMPTLLVRDSLMLDLGGRVLSLRAYGRAHTDTDLTVLDQASSTLWAGDLLFAGRVPSLEGNLRGWLAAIEQISAIPAARAIPGHGPATLPWPAGVDDERRYLTLLLHDVRAALAAGRDIDVAAATSVLGERSKWALFDSYNGHNVVVAYKELQWD